jgi:hypothetical protein
MPKSKVSRFRPDIKNIFLKTALITFNRLEWPLVALAALDSDL